MNPISSLEGWYLMWSTICFENKIDDFVVSLHFFSHFNNVLVKFKTPLPFTNLTKLVTKCETRVKCSDSSCRVSWIMGRRTVRRINNFTAKSYLSMLTRLLITCPRWGPFTAYLIYTDFSAQESCSPPMAERLKHCLLCRSTRP